MPVFVTLHVSSKLINVLSFITGHKVKHNRPHRQSLSSQSISETVSLCYQEPNNHKDSSFISFQGKLSHVQKTVKCLNKCPCVNQSGIFNGSVISLLDKILTLVGF